MFINKLALFKLQITAHLYLYAETNAAKSDIQYKNAEKITNKALIIYEIYPNP